MSADDGLRKLIQKHLPRSTGFIFSPLETGGTHNGIPDLYWAHKEGENGWLECKATTGWAVEVRPHQVSWCMTHVAAGVRVVVAIRARGVGSAAGKGDSLWLVKGAAIKELQDQGLRLPEEYVLGRWYGDPKTWDWGAVGAILNGQQS